MVEFINVFELQPGQEETFFDAWQEVNAYMRQKPGYLSHELFQALSPDARFRWVNHARWESAELWRAAHDENFRRMAGAYGFVSTPALYELVHQGAAEHVG